MAKFSNKINGGMRNVPTSVRTRSKVVQLRDVDETSISDGEVLVYDAAKEMFYGKSFSDIGGLTYKGVWNATTNTPTLVSSVGTQGAYYKVSVKGTTTLDGISDWEIGDLVLFNGTVRQRIAGGESYVDLTDNQTVGGVKTFSSSPIVPTPTNPTDVTNKGTSEAFSVAMSIAL